MTTTPSIRVLVVEDQALFREGMVTLLAAQPGLVVVGDAADGEEALRLAAAVQPDVVLMDLQMPVLDGVAATRRLHAAHPTCRVIALTTFDDDEFVFEALRAGAVGYLLKDTPSARLIEAIRATARGESFLQPSVAAKVVAEFARLTATPALRERAAQALVEPLSEREREILRWVARGASNREIAEQLVITEGTAKNHLTSILGKLGVRDRTQAAIKARELGLV